MPHGRAKELLADARRQLLEAHRRNLAGWAEAQEKRVRFLEALLGRYHVAGRSEAPARDWRLGPGPGQDSSEAPR